MKKISIIMSVLFCVCLLYGHLAISEDPLANYTPYFPNYPPLTPEEMMEYARQGAEYLENGGDIEEFNKNPGKFTKGVFLDYRYLSVGDCKTKTALAHPFMPNVVNVPGLMHKIKDATGRAYKRNCARLPSRILRGPGG